MLNTTTFIWRIKNFSLCHTWDRQKDFLSSIPFYVDSLKSKFCLRVYPRDEGSSENVGLYIVLLHSSRKDATTEYELSFVSADDSFLASERNVLTMGCGEKWGMKNFPTREEIFVTNRSSFLLESTLKVQCRLWAPGKVTMEPVFFYANSKILTEKIKTAFSVQEFSKLRIGEERLEYLKSYFVLERPAIFRLKFSGNGKTTEEMDVDVDIFADFKSQSLDAMCQLSLLNHIGEPVISRQSSRTFSPGYKSFKFEKFTTRQELVERKKEFLPGDVLSLMCEFFCSGTYHLLNGEIETVLDKHVARIESNTSELKRVHIAPTPSSIKTLSLIPLQEDLLSLYKEHNFSDFELRAEGMSFPVHKNILAARSPVFKALLASDMKEVTSGFQDVPDVDKDTLDRMLFFIYTDNVRDMQWESAAKLYYVADKYQILPLKQKCSFYLQANVDGSNVCQILEYADRHNDEQMKSAVEEFLLDHVDEMLISEEWEMFANRNSQLAEKTMRKMFSKLMVCGRK